MRQFTRSDAGQGAIIGTKSAWPAIRRRTCILRWRTCPHEGPSVTLPTCSIGFSLFALLASAFTILKLFYATLGETCFERFFVRRPERKIVTFFDLVAGDLSDRELIPNQRKQLSIAKIFLRQKEALIQSLLNKNALHL